jgi:hypothetical protein
MVLYCAMLISMNRDAQLAYCHEYMLPIWERWTDGNLDARRFLECDQTDPDWIESRLDIFIAAITATRRSGKSYAVGAALLAADVCLFAHIGVPADWFDRVCRRALEADAMARAKSRR